jgi:hypothetical protein
MKKRPSLICLDTIIVTAPLAVGFAFVLPFIAYEVSKELIKSKLESRK